MNPLYEYHPSKDEYLLSLLNSLDFLEDDDRAICAALLPATLDEAARSFAITKDKYLSSNGKARFHRYHFDQHAFLMILLARKLYLGGEVDLSEKLYFFNKSRYHIDWYPAVEFPTLTGFNHAFGAIIGKFTVTPAASLYFCQSCTIGSNIWFGNAVNELSVTYDGYSYLDGHLTMLPSSQLIGSKINGRVILSNGSCLINEEVDDLTICFGRSPNLIKKKISIDKWRSLFAFRM